MNTAKPSKLGKQSWMYTLTKQHIKTGKSKMQ